MRLLRGRKRLLKERTRITITVGGLLRLHGVSGEAQKMRGLRDRLDTLSTSHEKMAPHAPEIFVLRYHGRNPTQTNSPTRKFVFL